MDSFAQISPLFAYAFLGGWDRCQQMPEFALDASAFIMQMNLVPDWIQLDVSFIWFTGSATTLPAFIKAECIDQWD